MSYRQEVTPADPNEPTTLGVQPHRRRRRRQSWFKRFSKRIGLRFKWINALILVIAIVAVTVVGGLALIFDSVSRVDASITSFQRVINSLSNRPGTELTLTDFNRLDSSIRDLVSTLSSSRSRLGFVQPFASLNQNLNATFSSLEAAREIAMAARDMLNGLQPTLFFLVNGDDTESVVTQLSSGERVVELLRIGRGQFVSADGHLRNAQSAIDNLDLSKVPANVILNVEQLTNYLSQLTHINQILMDAPDVLTAALGISGERNYLVLSQNNDELRPSGGYISTYGWITVRNGRITNYNYSPTTTTSPNPPTASLADQLNIPSWWLRYQQPIYAAWDGSWYADFPSTAKMSMWYYNTGSNPQSPVDGVISIDIAGFESLLRVLGRVTVPGYDNAVITAQNFRTVVYDIRAYGVGEIPHKRFIAALYQEIFSEWQNQSLDPSKNSQLLGAMLQALQEKHIMMYFADAELNQAVDLMGWTGAQAQATNFDYLMVADANLGNKSNHSIIRQLTYDVDIQDDGSVSGRTTVSYDYSARVADTDPGVNPPTNGPADYNNLMQVFVPVGTALTDSTNLPTTPTVVTNDNNTEFISRVLVPFDSSQRFQFSYVTPTVIEDLGPYKRYRLLIQKQPGTPSNPVNVQIMLPQGSTRVSSTPDPDASYNLERPIVEYRLDLTVDHWIEIIYKG